jgi:3D (Asp-Asp-Asp) domain-containing protein
MRRYTRIAVLALLMAVMIPGGVFGQVDLRQTLGTHQFETASGTPEVAAPAPVVAEPNAPDAAGAAADPWQKLIDWLVKIVDRLVGLLDKILGGGQVATTPSKPVAQPATPKVPPKTQATPAKTTDAGKSTQPKAESGVPRGSGSPLKVKATGYFPPPQGGYKSKAQAAMEGGANDCRGKPLRTLQDYNPKDPKSYVSCATDPRVIKTGTYFTLDQFPGVRFLACDVGGGIKGSHIDICCRTEKDTYKLPSSVTVRAIK